MGVDRPTFSEMWYRVVNLHPRLNATAQTFRQHYRGETWHVIRDPASNQFFRLNEFAYHFVALLDGKRTVGEVWQMCNEQLGDYAPTQGEAIQLLGQLYMSNLVQADLPPDAEGLFDRYKRRVQREVGSYLSNVLFMRIPLFDPDNLLDKWVHVFGWLFSIPGLILWIIWLGFGFSFLAGKEEQLYNQAMNILDPAKLPLLYLCFAGIKAIHEFGHGFACKRFGRDTGTGGEVHTLGVMLLVFMPMPYVDASSAWAFRNKWHRAAVAAGGMYVELAVAALAAIIWSQTSGPVSAIAYNVLFIASVSTLLFNANPLLRYDGYYILCDLLEIPNLAQRSKEYLYFLVKKFVYGVRNPRNPAHTVGEMFWMPIYAIAAFIYRIFVFFFIFLFVAGQLFFIGVILAIVSAVMWVCVPVGKFINYLFVKPELDRTRNRALLATGIAVAVVLFGIGLWPVRDTETAEGVVEPKHFKNIYMLEDGQVISVLPSNEPVTPEGRPLLVATDFELENKREQVEAELKLLSIQIRKAQSERKFADVQALEQAVAARQTELANLDRRLSRLKIHAPFAGRWVCPKFHALPGMFLSRSEKSPIGRVASDQVNIRVVAGQELGPRIHRKTPVEIRIKGRPGDAYAGAIESIDPAGTRELPSAALGYMVGGTIETDMEDNSGAKAREEFFTVQVTPGKPLKPNFLMDLHQRDRRSDKEYDQQRVTPRLLAGQRVVVQFDLGHTPLAVQWTRMLYQMLQRRFKL